MFAGVLKTILNSTLGKFLQVDEINIGLSGLIELRNVELNAKTIETFLPVSLKLGRVGHLKIELSWLSLLTTPVKVTISDVYCVAALPKDGDVNVQELAEKLIQQKLETLINWELLNFPEKEVESDKGTLMKTVDTIIDHITVSVERVHVVFEERGINAGVTIGKVNVFPIDENDNQLLQCADSSTVARRKILVDGVGIYLNIDQDEAAQGALEHQYERDQKQGNITALTQGLYGTTTGAKNLDAYNKQRRANDPNLSLIDQIESSSSPTNNKTQRGFPPVTYEYCQSVWTTMSDPRWSWILVPFGLTVHFNMWKGTMDKLQAMVPPKPSMEGIISLGRIELAINREQYQGALTLMAQFLNNPASLAMLKLQTSQDTTELSKKDQSLLLEAEKNETIIAGMEYAQLYKRNFQGYKQLEESDTKKMVEIERKYPLTQILTWRAVALKVVQVEYQQDDKPYWRQKPASGFLSSWFGSAQGAPMPTQTIEDSLLRAFVEDPAALQHEEEKKSLKNVKANYTTMYFAANIAALAFSLVQPNRDQILEFGIYNIGAQIRMRPQGMGISAEIDKLEATDHLTKNALSRQFITKSASQSNEKFLTANISMGDKHINPEMGYDMVLKTKITGLDVLVNLPLLLSLGAFFVPPKHVAIASKTKNEIMGSLSSLKNTNALSVFESRGRQCMDIQITSPTIIIPTSVDKADAHVLVCRLGTLDIKATPSTLDELKEQKVLMERAAKDPSVLTKLDKKQQKQLFYDTFNISLYGVSISIGDPKLTHKPNDSVYIIRPMELNLAVSLCLLQQGGTLPPPKNDDDDDVRNRKKDNLKNDKAVVPLSATAALSQLSNLVLPGMLVDVGLPCVDVQISPLKIGRLLRLTKALLSTLKLSQKETDASSSALRIEEVIDQDFNKKETALVEVDTTQQTQSPPVNPDSTSMLISCHLGRVSLAITNDLIPMFPINVLFISMEGLYCAVAMRSLDMDVSMVLKSFYVQDCLNKYGGPGRFLLAGASRDLLDFGLNADNKLIMDQMLNNAYPYQDELPSDAKKDVKVVRRQTVTARQHQKQQQQSTDATTTAEVNSLQTAMNKRDSVITSAFLSCHVSMPQKTSPFYAFVSTLATAHFGQIVISVNRESIPPLAAFFAKQLLPNPALFTVEDDQFGQVGLDFMQDVEWGGLDDDLDEAAKQWDQEQKAQNALENAQIAQQQTLSTNVSASPEQVISSPKVNIDPDLGFDPNLLKSGLDIAAENAQFDDSNQQMPQFYSDYNNYNHTGFDMDRVMPMIHGPNITVPTSPSVFLPSNQKSNIGGMSINLDSLPQVEDDLKLGKLVHDFVELLIEIDEHEFNLHYFGLTRGVTAAYPSTMAAKPDFLKLMALYDQSEEDIECADGEDPAVIRQQFRNDQVRLRNAILVHEVANLGTIVANYAKHLDYIKGLNGKISASSTIYCTSHQLLTLHRYANTKVLIQLSRLQERERVLSNRSGAYQEKIELSGRIQNLNNLLQHRRTQLLALRNYERKIRYYRRIGCVSQLLCTDDVYNAKNGIKTKLRAGPKANSKNTSNENNSDDEFFEAPSSDTPAITNQCQPQQYTRVGVFCMPKSYQGDSISIENAIEKNILPFSPQNASNFNIENDPLFDIDTEDTVCPLIPARYIKQDAQFEKDYEMVPLDVLARVTFGGIRFTLTTQNVPILQFDITPFKLGFAQHSHGMSVKLLIGTLSLRQPSGETPMGTSTHRNAQKDKALIPSAENDFTHITRKFLDTTVEHQITRQHVQKQQKRLQFNNTNGSNDGQVQQLNDILTYQMVNLKQYIEDNYRSRDVGKGFYAGNKNSILMQKYTRFVENRQNYHLSYPDIIYTAPPTQSAIASQQKNTASSDAQFNLLDSFAIENGQLIDKSVQNKDDLLNNNEKFYMLDLSVQMHNPEMIIFDDTDEYDYYSLLPVHNLTGFVDLALGLQDIDNNLHESVNENDLFSSAADPGTSYRATNTSRHSAYSLRGKKVLDGQIASNNIPGLVRGSSLLQALSSRQKRNSISLNSLTAINKAGLTPKDTHEVVNTAVVTELPFNVPAFILPTNPGSPDYSPYNDKVIPTMTIKGTFRGIRMVVCYKSVDNLLKYIEGLDKCMAVVMANNSYTNTMGLMHNKIRQQGDLLRSSSLLSHISEVQSRLSNRDDRDDEDYDGITLKKHNSTDSNYSNHSTRTTATRTTTNKHNDENIAGEPALTHDPTKLTESFVLLDQLPDDSHQINNDNILMTKKAHVNDQFDTAAARPDFDRKPTVIDDAGRKVQKKLQEIGQAVNNLNNASDPEAPRSCPLLMDINISICDLAISMPVSSTSFELVSITLDNLSIVSSTILTKDTTCNGPVEGATFYASSNADNTASNATSKNILTNLLKQQSLFQRQTSLSKQHAAQPSSLGTASSLTRPSSQFGRDNSISFNPDSVVQRLRAASLINDDDDEFYDAEELDETHALAQVVDDDIDFSLPKTFLHVPDVPTDYAIFGHIADHKKNAENDKIHTLGKPTQNYEYKNVQINFSIALTGISITTLVLADDRGVREQSAAPRFDSILDLVDTNANDDESFLTPASPSSPSPTTMSRDKPRLQMLDLMSIGDIVINATHFTYVPFITITPPHMESTSNVTISELDAAMSHTAHTFYPRMPLPDWAVAMSLDNVDFLISQPQLSLLLSLISTHSVFPGNLGEKSIMCFPPYQPATPSTAKTSVGLMQLKHYYPMKASLAELRTLLNLASKPETRDAMAAISAEQAQAVLSTIQKTGMNKFNPKVMAQNASSTAPSNRSRINPTASMFATNTSRLSRIGSHMNASRRSMSSRGSFLDEDVDVWAQAAANDPSQALGDEPAPKKGLGVSVYLDIGRFSLQVIANPAQLVAESLCILLSTKTRFNMLPDGTIALTATLDDFTMVNAELPTKNPSILRDCIYALPTDKAILKPMSSVVAVSITPNTFNHLELLAPLPKMYTPSSGIKIKKNKDGTEVRINSFAQPTRRPGQVSAQVMNVSCVVTDMDMKVSYSDYEMLMSILGTLGMQSSDDFATIDSAELPGRKESQQKPQTDHDLGLDFDAADQAAASAANTANNTAVVEADLPTAPPVPTAVTELLHSMGDMTVSFSLPKMSILLVNDSPGFPLPFMRINIDDVYMNMVGFAHRRDILLRSNLMIAFHNGALVAWEPLLEPSSYEIGVIQSVTHPMQIKVASLGKVNLNVTRAMMEGLAQSLALLASAQSAQQKKIQSRLQRLNGITLVEEEDDIDEDDEGDEHDHPSQISASRPSLDSFASSSAVWNSQVLSNVGHSVEKHSHNRRYYQMRKRLSPHHDSTLIDATVKRRGSDKLKNFSFFRLDNHTEYQLYYQFGANLANPIDEKHLQVYGSDDLHSSATQAIDLIDVETVKHELLEQILEENNNYYSHSENLNKAALSLYKQVTSIQSGGYLPGSPQFDQYTATYERIIQSQRQKRNNNGDTLLEKKELSKVQKSRLFRFNVFYTAWCVQHDEMDAVKKLLKPIALDKNELSPEASAEWTKTEQLIDKINTKNRKALDSLSSTPLFFGKQKSTLAKVRAKMQSKQLVKDNSKDDSALHDIDIDSMTIGALLAKQHEQALDMIHASSAQSGAASHLLSKDQVRQNKTIGVKKQAEIAAQKLLSLQIAGYEPIHNIQVETVGFQSYVLVPGKTIADETQSDKSDDEYPSQPLEPLSVLIHVSVVQGIKVVSVRNARAMVNLTDSPLEVVYGLDLAAKTIIFPGETFYLPLMTQHSKKSTIDDDEDENQSQRTKFEQFDTFKTTSSFVSIRPITLVPYGRTNAGAVTSTNSVSKSKHLLKTVKDNSISHYSYSSYRYSYPASLDSLINGSCLVAEALIDDRNDNYRQFFGPNGQPHDISQQSNKNADFIAIVQRWRSNGLTYWALCPPFSITNLLSERALITLSTKEQAAIPDKKDKKAVVVPNKVDFGSEIVANIAPTHSLRCYSAVPTSTRTTAAWFESRKKKWFDKLKMSEQDRAEFNKFYDQMIDFSQFSARPDPQQQLYMTLSIPALGLTSKTPQVISKTGTAGTNFLYFDLVNARALQNCRESRKFKESDLRTLTVHCEVTQSTFLLNQKTTSAVSLPNVVTAQHSYIQNWTSQAESTLLSYTQNELEHITATSLPLLPSATSAAIKMVLFTPYWLFDVTNLGLLVSEGTKITDLKHLTPTQYDSPNNVNTYKEKTIDMISKLRTWNAVNEKSVADSLLEEHSKAIAIGAKLSSHNGNGGNMNIQGITNKTADEYGVPRDSYTNDGSIKTLLPGQENRTAFTDNSSMVQKLDERCYVKAAMFSSAQHQQVQSLQVVARLTEPVAELSTIDRQYPPQIGKDLTFISEQCTPFSLDAVGVQQTLQFKGHEVHQLMLSGKKDKMLYTVAVLVRNGQDLFKRTKQIFFSPHIVIVNKLPLPMLLRQHCLDDLASLKTQASQITSRFSGGKSHSHDNDQQPSGRQNGVRHHTNVSLNLLESTPDHQKVDFDVIDLANMNKRDPLYLEGKFHATASLVENTERFIPTDQTDTFHWPHAHEEKLVSFKLLTHDDPFTHIVEEEAVKIVSKSLKSLKNDITTQVKPSSNNDNRSVSPSGVEEPVELTVQQKEAKLLDNFDIRSIACPLPSNNAYQLQSDGHSVISALPTAANNNTDDNKNKNVKQYAPWNEGVWGWSGYFDPQQIGDQTIIVRNPITGKSLIVKIRIILTSPDIRNSAGNAITVIFEPQDLVFPKYRIENKTCSDTIRIAQAGSQEWLTLRPYDSTVYTWDQPLITGVLQVDVISGSATIHKEYSMDELGSKGTITVPGQLSHALNLLVAPTNQLVYDDNGKLIKQTRAQKKSDHQGELTLYHQQGGKNPILSDQSKRSTHTVFVYVRAEGPTRVLVISDFPATNQDVDLLTSQLLSTPDIKNNIATLYDQCKIGIRGVDVASLIDKWGHIQTMKATGSNEGNNPQLGWTENDITGPFGLRLLDEKLAVTAQNYESEQYFDDFCSQVAVLHRNPRQSSYQATVTANLAAQQFGYQEFNQKDQLVSQIAKLSALYPGFDIWDESLSEADIQLLSQEKGGSEFELNGATKADKDHTVQAGQASGDISSIAATGADALPLTAEELVDLVKVRAQTIKSIVIKHNNVLYQTNIVAALAKWQMLQAQPEMANTSPQQQQQQDKKSPPTSTISPKHSAMFTTPENPTGQPKNTKSTLQNANEPPAPIDNNETVDLTQEEYSLIANMKDDVAYLAIRVNEARWLTPASLTGLSDCYAMITFNNQTYRTHVALDTTNPLWASEMFFRLDGALLKDLRHFQSEYLHQLKSDPLATSFDLPRTAFNDLSLRVAIFHENTLLSDTFLGGLILSSLDTIIVGQLNHETKQLQQKIRNLSQNLNPNTNIEDVSSESKPHETNEPYSVNSPVLMLNRWFKLHALRHNKLLYGQCQLSFGFVSNELTKQQLLLYQLEQDLLEHILLLTRITFKYKQQLQSIDVGVIDLNTLYLQPQLSIPKNPAFIQAVKAKDAVKKAQKLNKKIKFKERPPKNGFNTSVTMTPIGPIRYPMVDFGKLYKRRPDLFRNVNLYPHTDPGLNQQQQQQGGPPRTIVTSSLVIPKFVPIPLVNEQCTDVLLELSNAAIDFYNNKINNQQEIAVCISIEDIALDLKHIYDCLLKEDKLLPEWIPTKIVALLQCNGHVSKMDLFDFVLPEFNHFTKLTANAGKNDLSGDKSTPSNTQQPDASPSQNLSGIGAALQGQTCESNADTFLDTFLDGLDYATILASETEQLVSDYGLHLKPTLGPNQGDITVLEVHLDEKPAQEESKPQSPPTTPSEDIPPSESLSRLSSAELLAALGTTLNKNATLTLNKTTGRNELITFTVPLSLIKSYVDPLNDQYGTIDTSHISSHDIPALTMTLLCEVQQNKSLVSGAENVAPTPISTPVHSVTATISEEEAPPCQSSSTLNTTQKPQQQQSTSVFESIGFATPLKASVHIADIDVPLVDLQYIDIYNPSSSIITMYDDHGVAYEVDSLGRRKEKLVVESHYYFARRAAFYKSLEPTSNHLTAVYQNDHDGYGNLVQSTGVKLMDRFTQRVAKPPTPIANLSESEIRSANNIYSTKNPHVMAAYLYHEHLAHQLSNYMQSESEQLYLSRLQQRQKTIIERERQANRDSGSGGSAAAAKKKINKGDIEEQFWSATPISTTVPYTKQIYGINSDEYPLLQRVPLSPVRATIKAHLQSNKPLIERPQMAIVLDVPHFGLSLVDSALGKAEELLYISSRGVVIDIEDSVTQRAIEFKVHNFQVDQCIEFGSDSASSEKESVQDSDKIIFGPSENALQSGQPFVHISINQTKTHPNYPVQVFKYATILIQEMSIRVEEALIWHLLRFSNDILPALSSSLGTADTTYTLASLVCDQRILFNPQNISSTALFYFSLLHIQPISLFLTFKINPDVRSSADDLTFNPIQTVLSAATGILGSIDAAPICLASLLISDASGDVTTLISPIVQFYVSQGIRQGHKVLGSVEILGNPVSLVNGLGSGVKDFFYEPAQGLVSSPKDFGTGLVRGSASLLRSVTTGLFGAASKVTGSVGKGLSTLTMDSSFQSSRRARNNKKIKHAGDGLLQGTKALSYGLFSGISGIVMNPLEGARSGGAKGFLVGIATGLTGVVTKTASGALDLISLSLQGLSNTFKLFDEDVEPTRARFPRFISSYGSMRSYDVTFALGRFVLNAVQPPKLDHVAKKVFSAITGLGSKNINIQRENDITVANILDFIDNTAFFDVDLASSNLNSGSLTSVLVEIEALLSSTIYGTAFGMNNSQRKKKLKRTKQEQVNAQGFTQKEMNKLKDIHKAVNERIQFLSTFQHEDLVTCYVVNNINDANAQHAKINNIDGMSPHATLIVLSTRRLIALTIGDVVKCSREGGALTGSGVKCNVLLDHLVDLTLQLADDLPDPRTNKVRQAHQQKVNEVFLNPNSNHVDLVGAMFTNHLQFSTNKKVNQKLLAHQKIIVKSQQDKIKRATNHIIITSSQGDDIQKNIQLIKLPIGKLLECQTTLLSLQSFLLRPRILIVKMGNEDISKRFASEFYKVPATPYAILGTNNPTVEFCEAVTLGRPYVQNILGAQQKFIQNNPTADPKSFTSFPLSRNSDMTPVLQQNRCYYPTEDQINFVLNQYHIKPPSKTNTNSITFDAHKPHLMLTTFRTFEPSAHGVLPVPFDYDAFGNKRRALQNPQNKNNDVVTDLFNANSFSMINTGEIITLTDPKTPITTTVPNKIAGPDGQATIVTTPEVLPLHTYPQSTLRTSPFALSLRKPTSLSMREWNERVLNGNYRPVNKSDDNVEKYHSKILSVTFTVGTHVVTREFTVFDESMILL